MTRRILVIAMFVVGLILVLVGTSWTAIAPPSIYWSEEKSHEYTKAFAAVHAAEDSGGHAPTAESTRQFDDARQRFADIKAELESARSLRDRTGTYVALAGMAMIFAALAFYKFGLSPS